MKKYKNLSHLYAYQRLKSFKARYIFQNKLFTNTYIQELGDTPTTLRGH